MSHRLPGMTEKSDESSALGESPPDMAPRPSGRLELTWANKDKSLLSHDDGSYEWVGKRDRRVAEVRLLQDAGTVGEVHDQAERAKDNLLIRGDALHALTALTKLPEFAEEYVGKVKLVYIDPPFNTGQAFEHYDDGIEHSVWLTMMRDRLVQVKQLLSAEGSVWIHLNDDEAAYCKVLLDEIFGRDCFVTTFAWQKVDSPNDNKVNVTPDHDFIHCYTARPGGEVGFARMPDEGLIDAYGKTDEDGRRYRDRLLKKNGKNSLRADRPKSFFAITDPDGGEVFPIHDDGREACWALGESGFQALLDQNSDPDQPDKLIWIKREGSFQRNPVFAEDGQNGSESPWLMDSDGERWVPYSREWAPEVPTRPWPTLWATDANNEAAQIARDALHGFAQAGLEISPDALQVLERIAELNGLDDVKTTRQAKAHLRALFPGITPFATPKPEQLMQRIIEMASKPGDVVLDFFGGSGSTLTTAHKLQRRWVGAERRRDTIDTFTAPRLGAVVAGEDTGGVTSATSWSGGGGFRTLDVAPSMYQEDQGLVFLADWATASDLSEAVAAQLGFDYEPDSPFCGRRGRVRLAVVDGHVTRDVAKALVESLEKGESLSLVATSVDPDVDEALGKMRRGSRARVAPEDLLIQYAKPSNWQVSVARQPKTETNAQTEDEAMVAEGIS